MPIIFLSPSLFVTCATLARDSLPSYLQRPFWPAARNVGILIAPANKNFEAVLEHRLRNTCIVISFRHQLRVLNIQWDKLKRLLLQLVHQIKIVSWSFRRYTNILRKSDLSVWSRLTVKPGALRPPYGRALISCIAVRDIALFFLKGDHRRNENMSTDACHPSGKSRAAQRGPPRCP